MYQKDLGSRNECVLCAVVTLPHSQFLFPEHFREVPFLNVLVILGVLSVFFFSLHLSELQFYMNLWYLINSCLPTGLKTP